MLKKTPWLVCLFAIQSSAFGGVPGERVIYGTDDRLDLYQVQNARDAALADSTVALVEKRQLKSNGDHFDITADTYGRQNSLCATEPFFDQPAAAFCSGSLVGPDIILTAGHCIKNAKDCAATKFIFNYSITKQGVYPTTALNVNVVGCKDIIARKQESSGSDFSIIRLDRAITNHVPLPINRAADLKVGDKIGVIGHPSGLPAKIVFGDSVVRSNDKPGYFRSNLDTYGGNSGSAVFNANTGLIEGILVRGATDFVYKNGCRISNVCAVDGCRGEDATKISEVAAMIPDPTRGSPPTPPKPTSRWPSSHVQHR
jgi:hypothetical protein